MTWKFHHKKMDFFFFKIWR